MALSRGYNRRGTAHRERNMTHWKKLLSAFGLGVFVAVVLLAFSAYLNPAMLIGLANLRLCS